MTDKGFTHDAWCHPGDESHLIQIALIFGTSGIFREWNKMFFASVKSKSVEYEIQLYN